MTPTETPGSTSPSSPNPSAKQSAEDAPDRIAHALSKVSAWPAESGSVEWIQTHISHVFLTPDRVFKLRKAVRFPFLDFSSRASRNADCVNEVFLNRRLAPSIYLGIAPVRFDGQSAEVGDPSETLSTDDCEHLVVMRRLPAGRDALSLLEQDQLESTKLDRVAALLSSFHAENGLGRPAPWSREEWLSRISLPIFESLAAINETELVEVARIDRLEARVGERIESLRPIFERRRIEGRAVDAHGDLHLDHIWFEQEQAEPQLIDCLEFNEDLRKIDSASEVAFLSMDLRYRGRADLAESFLASYALATDDYGMFAVVDFFAAYRALVRAKVAALAAMQDSVPEAQRAKARESAERHFELAEDLLDTPPSAGVVLLCGTVGCGKSTVARYLSQSGCGIPIASDRVRKSILGVAPATRLKDGPDEGAYSPDRVEDVYRAMLERAEVIVESGRTAILDASYSSRAHRDATAQWAARRGIRARLIEVRCETQTALGRLRKREALGKDPSDAGPDFLPISESRFEPPDEWPTSDHVVVWTDRNETAQP